MAWFLVLLFVALLGDPELAFKYAERGLRIWSSRIVPVLLPFMIAARLIVRSGQPEWIKKTVNLIFKPIFKIGDDAIYVVCIGFLGGFPLGGMLVSELYSQKRISKSEAKYLLSFCNMLSPGFFLGVCIPLLGINNPLPYCLITYGTAFLYGVILRRTVYKELVVQEWHFGVQAHEKSAFGQTLQEAISASVTGILNIGAYMIFFQILLLVPKYILNINAELAAPIIEISAGLPQVSAYPLYSLFCFSFGGLCCAFQAEEYLNQCGISLGYYIKHKIILSLITTIVYYLYFRLFT